jgi:hypothetical protein
MSNAPKPCTYCDHTTYYYFPKMALPIDSATTVLGMAALKHQTGAFFEFSMISCQNCGLAQMFLTSPDAVRQQVPGSQIIQAQRT